MAALHQRKIETKAESAVDGSESIGNDDGCTYSPKKTPIGSGDTKTNGKPTKKRGKGILMFLGDGGKGGGYQYSTVWKFDRQ